MKHISIRWKLFALIAGAVAVPIGFVMVVLPMSRVTAIETQLRTKASSFSRMLVEQTRSAIAFDDAATAREVFGAVSSDSDVAAVALYRANGSVLAESGTTGTEVPTWTAVPLLAMHGNRVRIVTPVIADEGPRGLLMLELSTAGARAEGAKARREVLFIGLVGLFLGCATAWLVGTSFGRRLLRIRQHAGRVAGGDFSDQPRTDRASDEIGDLASEFKAMVVRLRGAYADIERQVVERTEALRASNEQNRALLETTNAVPWEMDATSWRFTYVGPQAATLFGVPTDAWAEEASWTQLIQPDDLPLFKQALAGAATERADRVAEVRLRRPERRDLWIRTLITAAPDGAGPRLRGFMFDVTERVEMQAELQQAQKLESVGRLASGVAHEINTPIQFVSDSVHFVRDALGDVLPLLARYRQVGRDGGELAGGLEEINQAAETADIDYIAENAPPALERALEGLERVATIVRSMKQFAHPDRHGKAMANLNEALASTLVIARTEYKEVADVETSYGSLPDVSCHVGELNQAFLNIIVNASHAIGDVVKKTGQRGLIKVVTRYEDGAAVIEISDSGGGIPEAIRPRIFDPFFTTKEVGRGTGQGLAIAHRSVIDKHGGALTFESEMGRGTTFVIRIPNEPAAGAQALVA